MDVSMRRGERRELSCNLDTSFMTMDSSGVLMPKTPEGAQIVATTYLMSNYPLKVIQEQICIGPYSLGYKW
jgi:hypothetical protein